MTTNKASTAVKTAIMVLALCTPAFAAGDGVVSELRLGVYDHNSDLMASRHETSDPDINAEILFRAPSWLQWMAHPRLNLGFNRNTGNGTSSAYTGFVWDYNLTDAFFVEGGFGGAIHNGETKQETATQLNLGCRVLFHENGSIGYRFTDNASVMVTVDHISNAGLCDSNPGLTNVGVRLGYAF